MIDNLLTRSNVILDSLSDGVYVCDRERKIVYWSKSAERITGWLAEDVVGRRCLDDVLCHVDKDGHRLCGEEFCPLHRSIVTGTSTNVPLIVFAQAKAGHRVPMQVSVAPIRDAGGEVIGGVETFRDMSPMLADLKRAERIQTLSLEQELPQDSRIRFSTLYTPHDMVGGDYFAIRPIDANRYGFLLADAMGHGVAAALHTMHLSSLWGRLFHLLGHPAEFARKMNHELSKVVKDESFATAVCGVIDARNRTLSLASAGGPPAVIVHADGGTSCCESAGLPFGLVDDADYNEVNVQLAPAESVLLFSDGAFEIHNSEDQMLGIDGLLRILKSLGYPDKPIRRAAVELELLRFSNAIRLDDDVTFIEARLDPLD